MYQKAVVSQDISFPSHLLSHCPTEKIVSKQFFEIAEKRTQIHSGMESNQNGIWTAELTEFLKNLTIKTPYSASKIAEIINETFEFMGNLKPVTRNGIIGKCHRCGFKLEKSHNRIGCIQKEKKFYDKSTSLSLKQSAKHEKKWKTPCETNKYFTPKYSFKNLKLVQNSQTNETKNILKSANALLTQHHKTIIEIFDVYKSNNPNDYIKLGNFKCEIMLPESLKDYWPTSNMPLPYSEQPDHTCCFMTGKLKNGENTYCSEKKMDKRKPYCLWHDKLAHA